MTRFSSPVLLCIVGMSVAPVQASVPDARFYTKHFAGSRHSSYSRDKTHHSSRDRSRHRDPEKSREQRERDILSFEKIRVRGDFGSPL